MPDVTELQKKYNIGPSLKNTFKNTYLTNAKIVVMEFTSLWDLIKKIKKVIDKRIVRRYNIDMKTTKPRKVPRDKGQTKMTKAKKKRGAPLKNCSGCGKCCHARVANCSDCGYVFYAKKNNRQEIKDWQSLKRNDVIKSVKGHGPYWINPETKEKTYMGSYGRFRVQEVGPDYIMAYSIKAGSGIEVIYMGNRVKSQLCDNLYNCPHKLVRVNSKGGF